MSDARQPGVVSVLLRVMEPALSDALHASACARVEQARWYFGHSSAGMGESPFWKMDLDGDPVFDAVWAEARPACEALVGRPLRVIRQYANGHTYGLGGSAHHDDTRPGTFTWLYYPMRRWESAWEGETMFFDGRGEVVRAVRPRPNRAILFDARIAHLGRAPSRSCAALRVTVAFKLEVVPDGGS